MNDLAAPSSDPKVNKVFGWILTGANEHEIVKAIEKEWPGDAPRPLIIEAMNAICQSAEADPVIVKGFCIEATRLVYHQALKAKDFDLALRAIAQMHRLASAA